MSSTKTYHRSQGQTTCCPPVILGRFGDLGTALIRLVKSVGSRQGRCGFAWGVCISVYAVQVTWHIATR
eukprot:2335216-Amphidinium_carterae.1